MFAWHEKRLYTFRKRCKTINNLSLVRVRLLKFFFGWQFFVGVPFSLDCRAALAFGCFSLKVHLLTVFCSIYFHVSNRNRIDDNRDKQLKTNKISVGSFSFASLLAEHQCTSYWASAAKNTERLSLDDNSENEQQENSERRKKYCGYIKRKNSIFN